MHQRGKYANIFMTMTTIPKTLRDSISSIWSAGPHQPIIGYKGLSLMNFYIIPYAHERISNFPSLSCIKNRFNMPGWDLNRNFPDYFEDNLRFTHRAKEVQAVMKWSNQLQFVVSANFHDGAVVANFPYENYPGGGTLL